MLKSKMYPYGILKPLINGCEFRTLLGAMAAKDAMIAALLHMIQQQNETIAALSTRVASLESRRICIPTSKYIRCDTYDMTQILSTHNTTPK